MAENYSDMKYLQLKALAASRGYEGDEIPADMAAIVALLETDDMKAGLAEQELTTDGAVIPEPEPEHDGVDVVIDIDDDGEPVEVNRPEVTVVGDIQPNVAVVATGEAGAQGQILSDKKAPRVEAEATPEEQTELRAWFEKHVPGPDRFTASDTYGFRNKEKSNMTPRYLPPPFTEFAWASYKIGDGIDIANRREAGYVPVEVGQASMNGWDKSKIYLPYFYDYGGIVAYKDCILMIANAKVVAARKAANARGWNKRVEHEHGGQRGEAVRDRVVDSGTGRSYLRTSVLRSEDLFGAGDS